MSKHARRSHAARRPGAHAARGTAGRSARLVAAGFAVLATVALAGVSQAALGETPGGPTSGPPVQTGEGQNLVTICHQPGAEPASSAGVVTGQETPTEDAGVTSDPSAPGGETLSDETQPQAVTPTETVAESSSVPPALSDQGTPTQQDPSGRQEPTTILVPRDDSGPQGLEAHLRHGDVTGACPVSDEETAPLSGLHGGSVSESATDAVTDDTSGEATDLTDATTDSSSADASNGLVAPQAKSSSTTTTTPTCIPASATTSLSSSLTSSSVTSSSLTSSGLTSSGLTSSGLTSSGLTTSSLTSSGLTSSGLTSTSPTSTPTCVPVSSAAATTSTSPTTAPETTGGALPETGAGKSVAFQTVAGIVLVVSGALALLLRRRGPSGRSPHSRRS